MDNDLTHYRNLKKLKIIPLTKIKLKRGRVNYP